MRQTMGEVAERVRSEGLAGPGEMDALRRTLEREAEDDMPWYMRAAVGAGAWTATAFLLAFLFGIQVLENDIARIIFGIVLATAALFVRREADAEFMRHASVAASLAGMGLIIVSIGAITHSGTAAGLVGVVLSIAMIVLMPDRIHRFLSTLIAVGCAMVAVLDMERRAGLEVVAIPLLILTALVWRFGVRDRTAAAGEMLEPVGYGLIVAVFVILLYSAATGGQISPIHNAMSRLGIATTLAVAVMLLALVASILREHGTPVAAPASLVVLGTIVLLAAVTRTSPGIIAGVAVLVLGFDRRNPLLIGMAALFLTVFGSVYDSSLSLTLMEKAGVLAASGLVLLAARGALARGASPVQPAPAGGGE